MIFWGQVVEANNAVSLETSSFSLAITNLVLAPPAKAGADEQRTLVWVDVPIGGDSDSEGDESDDEAPKKQQQQKKAKTADAKPEFESTLVAILRTRTSEMATPQLLFGPGERFRLRCEGPGAVHFSGAVEVDEEDQDDDDDDEEDDYEYGDEDTGVFGDGGDSDEDGMMGSDDYDDEDDEDDEDEDEEDDRIVEIEEPKSGKQQQQQQKSQQQQQQQKSQQQQQKPQQQQQPATTTTTQTKASDEPMSKSQMKKLAKKRKAEEAAAASGNGATTPAAGASEKKQKSEAGATTPKAAAAAATTTTTTTPAAKPTTPAAKPATPADKATTPTATGPRVIKGPGGLEVMVNEAGKGKPAVKGRRVEMSYIGRLPNGKVFDQSGSFSFRVGQGEVIKGWDMAVLGANGQPLTEGTKARITCPPALGYGSKALDGIPANSTLVFDVTVKKVF